MSNDNVKAGEYCYNLVMSKFTEGVHLDNSSNNFVEGWSPNNLRRIFISPDGVILQYFTTSGAKINRLVQPVLFKDDRRCMECFYDEKYKPIVSMLVGKRICSSLEEIIYLTASAHGRQLPERELRLQELVERSKVQSNEEELLKNISDRFVRLRALIFLNITMQELTSLQQFSSNIKNGAFMFADDEYFRGTAVKIYDLHKNDWWKHTRLRPQYYGLDAEGTSLTSYFERVREIKSSEEKENKLSNIKEKAAEDKLNKYENLVKSVEMKSKEIFKHMVGVSKMNEVSPAFPFNFIRDDWQSINPDFRSIDDKTYVKTGRESGSKIFYKGLLGFSIDIKDKPNGGVSLEELNNNIKLLKAINYAMDEYCIRLYEACVNSVKEYNPMIYKDLLGKKINWDLIIELRYVRNLSSSKLSDDLSKYCNSTGTVGITLKDKIYKEMVNFAYYVANFFREVDKEV